MTFLPEKNRGGSRDTSRRYNAIHHGAKQLRSWGKTLANRWWFQIIEYFLCSPQLRSVELLTKILGWFAMFMAVSWWFQRFLYVHLYLAKWCNLTSIFFQMGWSHQGLGGWEDFWVYSIGMDPMKHRAPKGIRRKVFPSGNSYECHSFILRFFSKGWWNLKGRRIVSKASMIQGLLLLDLRIP